MLVLDFFKNHYLRLLRECQGFWSLKPINSKIELHSNMVLIVFHVTTKRNFSLFHPTPCFLADYHTVFWSKMQETSDCSRYGVLVLNLT
jgi:hypothetical protein